MAKGCTRVACFSVLQGSSYLAQEEGEEEAENSVLLFLLPEKSPSLLPPAVVAGFFQAMKDGEHSLHPPERLFLSSGNLPPFKRHRHAGRVLEPSVNRSGRSKGFVNCEVL